MLRTNNILPYGGATHNTYCIAMFVRACKQSDSVAQAWVERRFRMTVLNWIRRHPCREAACIYHPEAYYAARTFEHFWHMAQRLPAQCPELPAFLRYMHACVNAVIMDALRTPRREIATLPQKNATSDSQHDSQEVWKDLQRTFTNPREQRLAYLLYACDLKPVEIARSFPQEFGDVAEINSLRRAMLERLRQDV